MNGRIAITGGIGCGKSFVAEKLRERGIDVYDCDGAAKRLIAKSQDIHRRLTTLIGSNAYLPNGELNKAVVAEFLLASDDNNKEINDIVHPAVADDFIRSGVEWMECAILYESGFDRLVDKVVAVTAPEEVRVERIMKRDCISRQRALEWIKRQMPQDEVRRRADFEIINDGRQNVDCQLDKILTILF